MFCIDIAAYAIMSNHYHLVLRINQKAALSLTNNEIISRWKKLAKLPIVIQRQQKGEYITEAEKIVIHTLIQRWQKRLYDISWFMRYLNEPIARMANEEDNCTDRFWSLLCIPVFTTLEHPCSSEDRYKSQALLDEAALLTCMTYVDLNPIRAEMALTPEASDFTFIQSRIKANQTQQSHCQPIKLQHFLGNEKANQSDGIPFDYHDYLQLVDTTGRAIVENKRGAIPQHLAPILQRLGIEPENWLDNVTKFETRFGLAIGTIEKLQVVAKQLKQKWLKGVNASRQLYKLQPS